MHTKQQCQHGHCKLLCNGLWRSTFAANPASTASRRWINYSCCRPVTNNSISHMGSSLSVDLPADHGSMVVITLLKPACLSQCYSM
jgi:hypothetical protein